MKTIPPPPDPAELIESLDPDAIRERLMRLHRQDKALRVLLRAAIARRRYERPTAEEAPPDAT